jgi:hypothetical protein
MHFVPWWIAPPAIVAEALTAVPNPLFTALRPGPPASAAAVAAAIAGTLRPSEADAPAPEWLLESQHASFRRVLAAVTKYRGAVLADPVGSGKTYVALATAATLNRGRTTACLVPATLIPKWAATAEALKVRVSLCSHQQASRGRLPHDSAGLVIIDESHHFRTRSTKRYAFVADWLVNRTALLVTATPIINFLSDLGHQLLLAVRDNALAFDGIQSLRELFANSEAHPALGHLVLESCSAVDSRPRKSRTTSAASPDECRELELAAGLIEQLRLSRSDSVARLIRGVLLRAAGSSPAALCCSLRRYRRLLLHARDAARSGRVLERTAMRRFTAELGDQLVWWELLNNEGDSSDLELADLDVLDHVIPSILALTASYDPKLCRLRALLEQDMATLVFTGSRDTVRYIRTRLNRFNLAWCTGQAAGIGRTAMARDTVLGWFRAGAPGGGPSHLLVTDVAAEGLDLQRAARVIHYDLPWTPARLEQREGRSVRLGSRHREVQVVRFGPPAGLERALRLEATLHRKSRLPAAIGVGTGGHHVWRWRADIAAELADVRSVSGVAKVISDKAGLLVGVALYSSEDPALLLSASVGWLDPRGAWSEDSELLTDRFRSAAAQGNESTVGAYELRMYLELLTPIIRNRMAATRGRRWLTPDPGCSARAVADRLRLLIRDAAKLRQDSRLSELEAALAFVAGGHTAGEERLLDRLVGLPARDLLQAVSGVDPQPHWTGVEVRLTGLIIFGGAAT